MITPAIILKKDFTRGVRGYREEEVDQFLDQISVDLDELMRDNEALKARVKELQIEIERYRGSEKTMLGTLEAAKSLMTDISASAEKRADILMKNAELEAERIRREARESVEHTTEEATALSRRWELFSARFRDLLESELERFNDFSMSLLPEEPKHGKSEVRRGAQGAAKHAMQPLVSVNPGKTFKSPRQQ